MSDSPGKKFRLEIEQAAPLQIVGTVNAYAALMATGLGHRAIYLSGAGCANSSYGRPDLGLTTREEVLVDVKRITSVCNTPLLVDIDTGWGTGAEIEKTISLMEAAGAAAVHIEDQLEAKRCGHRPGKVLVEPSEMADRIASSVAGKQDADFFVFARTDSYSVEGIDSAIDRAGRYVEAGADGIFAEAMTSLDEYQRFASAMDVPVLANMTEFGVTPFFSRSEFNEAGIKVILYPLSANRAMNRAAEQVYQSILSQGTQKERIEQMQTRVELYHYLDYHRQEEAQRND